jgi:hypothetical protein
MTIAEKIESYLNENIAESKQMVMEAEKAIDSALKVCNYLITDATAIKDESMVKDFIEMRKHLFDARDSLSDGYVKIQKRLMK